MIQNKISRLLFFINLLLAKIQYLLPKVQRKLKLKSHVKFISPKKTPSQTNLNLNLGCGPKQFENFINIDLDKQSKPDIVWNISKGLPFRSNSASTIYNEHFIEHISKASAYFLFREAYRCLEPNGILRIATPDLEKMIQRYQSKPSYLQKKDLPITAIKYDYEWIRTPCELLNIGFRHWEHQWIYDQNELTQMAQISGFNDISVKEINQSDHTELKNKEHREPEASIILEFKKTEKKLTTPMIAYLFFEHLLSNGKSPLVPDGALTIFIGETNGAHAFNITLSNEDYCNQALQKVIKEHQLTHLILGATDQLASKLPTDLVAHLLDHNESLQLPLPPLKLRPSMSSDELFHRLYIASKLKTLHSLPAIISSDIFHVPNLTSLCGFSNQLNHTPLIVAAAMRGTTYNFKTSSKHTYPTVAKTNHKELMFHLEQFGFLESKVLVRENV